MNIDSLKFPIGRFNYIEEDCVELDNWIRYIKQFPKEISKLTSELNIEQLNWKYRPDGWTIKQVVHHCADSHLNSIIRFKLALTEEKPTVRPYFEHKWAELIDSLDNDISFSLSLIESIHYKWVLLLDSMSEEQFKLKFIHPEHNKEFNLYEATSMYAWHCEHHLSHIRNALKFKGKFNANINNNKL